MKSISSKLTIWLVTCFYIGHLPKAPGTWGSVVGVGLYILLAHTFPPVYVALGVVCLAAISIFLCENYVQIKPENKDPKEVVIDEVVGQFIALMFLPLTVFWVVLAFVLFRVLDIYKPLFIGELDRKTSGGFGIMVDDMAAGLITNMICQILLKYVS